MDEVCGLVLRHVLGVSPLARGPDTYTQVPEDSFRKEVRFDGQREERQTRCPEDY